MKYGEKRFSIWRMEFLHLQCGTITTLISAGDCTLQCGMWLWNRDSEFTKWQYNAMWYVALAWHAMEFAQISAILKIVFRHILFYFVFFNAVWVLTSGGFRIVSDTLVYDRKPQSYAQDNKTKFNCTHNFIHQSMADTKYSKLDG